MKMPQIAWSLCLVSLLLAAAPGADAQTASSRPGFSGDNSSTPARPTLGLPSSIPPVSDAPADVGEGATNSQREICPEELARRLKRLEELNARLVTQNNRLADQNGKLAAQGQALSARLEAQGKLYEQLNRRLENVAPLPSATLAVLAPPVPPSVGLAAAPPSGQGEKTPPAQAGDTAQSAKEAEKAQPTKEGDKSQSAESSPPKFSIGGYDRERGQFVLVRPEDAQRLPFELRADLFTQARYTNFAPSASTWTDSTGTPRPIRSINSFEVMRNFVQFSGFALDPRLQFTAFIFSSTAINDTVYLGWINYRFSDAFDLRVGNWAVPGAWEWYTSFRYTLGVDRSMATTFFRPNISPGVWAQGEPIENFHYVAMVANSLNRFNQGIDRISSSFAFGGAAWWEPFGKFGPGPSDVEYSTSPRARLGVNLAVSREANQGTTDARLPNPEDTIIRLSDGTPLFRPGALGPGVSLTATSVQLWTLDAAFKYRGLGISGEYFFRWLDAFAAVGSTPSFSSLFDHGALLQGSCFVLPKKFETYARSSFVTGRFGTGSEFGGGFNWYPFGTRDCRITGEVLYVSHSPAQNLLTGYRAGESGTLIQVQWFVDF